MVPTLPGVRFLWRSRPPAACRSGAHRYTISHKIGPGIQRRICEHCSAVSIDLTSEDSDIAQGLFAERTAMVPADQ